MRKERSSKQRTDGGFVGMKSQPALGGSGRSGMVRYAATEVGQRVYEVFQKVEKRGRRIKGGRLWNSGAEDE